MPNRDKVPAPIVEKTPRGLIPVNPHEAERLFADAAGTQYDLVKRSVRSNPQNSLYWVILGKVVKATGMWPTDEHLHDELKLICGFKRMIVNWETGEVTETVDSTRFKAMSQDEFNVYFTVAMEKLSDYLGTDPMKIARAA